MDAGQISELCAPRAEELCQLLLPAGKRKGVFWLAGSVGGEEGKSLSVHLSGPHAGRWKDFACAEHHGDLIDLWRFSRGVDMRAAMHEIRRWLNLPDDFSPRASVPRVVPAERHPQSDIWIELQRTMRRGLPADFNALATLRRIPRIEGIQLASDAGQLWFGDVWDDGRKHASWILTDGARRNAQARKMDGALWTGIGNAKAKTIAGCEARWPVGITEASAHPEVAFVEGSPDFLAAWHFIWLSGRANSIRPVAMFGGANLIHAEALPLFKNKTIWMHPHNDDGAGAKAAANWTAQLQQAGAAEIETMDFGIGMVKDLCDVAAGGLCS